MPLVIPQTINAEHVTGAALMFQHPISGYRYYGVCEKYNSPNQDFVVYRRKEDEDPFEFVAKLDGQGRDAEAFVTMGGAMITRNGALEMWASGQPVGQPDGSGTGYDAIGAIVPGVDLPWAFPQTVSKLPPAAPVKLNPPDGFDPYRGADKSYAPSNEVVNGLRVHYFSQSGKGPQGFGVYVFRQIGTNRAEPVTFTTGPLPEGRGDLDEMPD